ncbi:MAG: SCP2 sterol-binding domain-containing protein [Bacillota bacterium]
MRSLEQAMQAMRDRAEATNLAARVQATFQIEVAGDGGGVFHLVLCDGQATVGQGPAARPDCVIFTFAENWWDLIDGKADPRQLVTSGRMRIRGDMGLASQLASLLPGGRQ